MHVSVWIGSSPHTHIHECSETFTQAPGKLNRLLNATSLWSTCKFHFHAPADSAVVVSITALRGFSSAGSGGRCRPRLVFKNVGPLGTTHLLTVQGNQERTLPIVVQSLDNELKVVFRGHTCSEQMSSFDASYSFYSRVGRKAKYQESYPLVRDARKTSDHSVMITTPGTDDITSAPQHRNTTDGNNDSKSQETNSSLHLFFLAILAPITLVCLLCCLIMYIRQRNDLLMPPLHHRSQRLSMSTPSDTTPPTSELPLMQGRPFSSEQQQEMLRQQRETVCRRSESTEDYPSTVVHYDEEAHPFMRSLRLFNEDVCRSGIRAPPNRTVFDSIESSLSMKQPQAPLKKVLKKGTVHRTDTTNRAGSLRGKPGLQVLDSETKTPLKLLDPDSEGPPPYLAVVKKQHQQQQPRPSSEVLNVCDRSQSHLVAALSEPSVQRSVVDTWPLPHRSHNAATPPSTLPQEAQPSSRHSPPPPPLEEKEEAQCRRCESSETRIA
ncbi:uncharacterized protein LOC110982191 isoform X2 [Acanthaster planci]|uniref:Uncharacterized protein LOC110982191 isoform X2 n=1 Tax=Acanthaster planci TaxID=133434 RepID=A0A8B7YTW8_ACAPL|nr:uncharacterized protein LOC110982191 isoform X2 [Acanthaster planci]